MNNEEAQAQRAAKRRVYNKFYNSPEGQVIMNDLLALFGGTTLKKDKEGRIDPHASIARAGCMEVLLYIQGMSDATTAGDS